MPNWDTEWITTKEAAELTGYSIQYIRRLLNNDRVAGKKWARDWLVDKAALLTYQEKMAQLGAARYDPWRTGSRQRETEAED